MGIAILETMGLILAVLGCVLWKRQKITILHDYHRDRVLDGDKKAYAKVMKNYQKFLVTNSLKLCMKVCCNMMVT